jgi:hypothetical protein
MQLEESPIDPTDKCTIFDEQAAAGTDVRNISLTLARAEELFEAATRKFFSQNQ